MKTKSSNEHDMVSNVGPLVVLTKAAAKSLSAASLDSGAKSKNVCVIGTGGLLGDWYLLIILGDAQP